ncbi:MAG: F0F1 ATP synthase subunit A [Acidimicrobiia bacterium]|nr:F0F1 ATP synthase subunit A [Acidimicrobiia bacterium]
MVWPNYFGGDSIWALNKIGLISLLAMGIPAAMFLLSKKEMVPRGLQNVVEGSVEFVEDQIIMPAIGPEGLRYLPLLLSIFLFVFFGNIFEVIPTFQMPANARMANPMFLGLLVLVVFTYLGFKNNGLGYLKEIIWPSYVPVGLRWLVGFIEFFSIFLIRPFSLAVRLFANMLAGHILLVTFGALTIAVFTTSLLVVLTPLTFGMLVILTAFEIFVSFLQAFVFAILTAVYIDSSLHAH